MQSHGTHYRSGIFSTDVADASGGVIIIVKQGSFFSELSTCSLSSLGPYSDYVEVNISRSHFLMFMLPPFVLLRRIAEPISFLSPFFPPMWKRKRWIFRASASASTEKVPLPASASTSLLVNSLNNSIIVGLIPWPTSYAFAVAVSHNHPNQ